MYYNVDFHTKQSNDITEQNRSADEPLAPPFQALTSSDRQRTSQAAQSEYSALELSELANKLWHFLTKTTKTKAFWRQKGICWPKSVGKRAASQEVLSTYRNHNCSSRKTKVHIHGSDTCKPMYIHVDNAFVIHWRLIWSVPFARRHFKNNKIRTISGGKLHVNHSNSVFLRQLCLSPFLQNIRKTPGCQLQLHLFWTTRDVRNQLKSVNTWVF